MAGVRIPRSWAGKVTPLAGSGPAVSPQIRRIHVTDVALYTVPVTVDLGNDGMAPFATFGAGGGAQAAVGPTGLGASWSLDQCFLSTSIGQLDAAQCVVYVGPNGSAGVPQYAVTGSLAGGGSQFGMGGVGLPDGWVVTAVWTGGTVGAQAYLRVTGLKTVLSA